jgi:DNA-binding transcriptional ArsR family regulator
MEMTRPLEDFDDARAGTALTHPLRLAILWELEYGPASPAELARRLEARVASVSYHARRLHELGLVDADEPEHVQGNVRHTYRLAARPRITPQAWAGMSVRARREFSTALMHRVQRAATAAVREGGFDRPDALLARTSMALDARGFEEASAILEEAIHRLTDVERRAAERLARHGSKRLDGTAIVMLFETPTADSPRETMKALDDLRRNGHATAGSER